MRVENTLAAFANAVALGAAGAELDAHLTADGQVVVHHDAYLNPSYCRHKGVWIEQTAAPALAELKLEALADYDIGMPRPGSDYARRFDRILPVEGQRIPTLRDVIQLVKSMSDNFFLVIEIKSSVLDGSLRDAVHLVDAVLEVVEQESFGHRFCLCSFDWRALHYAVGVRKGTRAWFNSHPLSWYGSSQPSADDIPPSSDYLSRFRAAYKAGGSWFGQFDPRNFDGSFAEAIAAAGGDTWFLYHTDCVTSRVEECRAHGLMSGGWSVNLRDAGALRALEEAGADWACIDYPDMLV